MCLKVPDMDQYFVFKPLLDKYQFLTKKKHFFLTRELVYARHCYFSYLYLYSTGIPYT